MKLGMFKYPTKKQILAETRPIFKKGVMIAISLWKSEFYKNWENKNPDFKFIDLEAMAVVICRIYNKPDVKVLQSDWTMYKDSQIYLDSPSIISLFHELAHHLFGHDELTACRWSVWLYQLRFRKDYNKLVWNKHLLVKPLSSKRVVAQSPSSRKVATIV